jgi:hypothetical protein
MYRFIMTLTSALVGREWPVSRRYRFVLGERAPGTHRAGSLMDPRTCGRREGEKYLAPMRLQHLPLYRPACASHFPIEIIGQY